MFLARWISIVLLIVLISLTQVSITTARYLSRLDNEAVNPQDTQPLNQMSFKPPRKEPRLFEMLISALSDMEPDYDLMEETRPKEGPDYKHSKPCYWSLVSCYRKRSQNSE